MPRRLYLKTNIRSYRSTLSHSEAKLRFIVLDFTGDELRRFRSRREAKWFMEGKSDCSLKILPEEPKVDLIDIVGECLF
jgi:gluconate kinase